MAVSTISREALAARLRAEDPPVVAEALGPRYYDDAHLPDAVNLDPARFDELVPVLFPSHDQAIVVYCASETCRNSHEAAARLVALGYTDVSVYEGGKADWIAAGLPVESTVAV
jgi:rhodanese-related sulfurtransferase